MALWYEIIVIRWEHTLRQILHLYQYTYEEIFIYTSILYNDDLIVFLIYHVYLSVFAIIIIAQCQFIIERNTYIQRKY